MTARPPKSGPSAFENPALPLPFNRSLTMTFRARKLRNENMGAAIILSSCCGLMGCTFGEAQQLPATELTVDGVTRTYHLFVPVNPPEEPMPLLVAVHGGGGEGFAFPQQERFEALEPLAGEPELAHRLER